MEGQNEGQTQRTLFAFLSPSFFFLSLTMVNLVLCIQLQDYHLLGIELFAGNLSANGDIHLMNFLQCHFDYVTL